MHIGLPMFFSFGLFLGFITDKDRKSKAIFLNELVVYLYESLGTYRTSMEQDTYRKV